MDKLTLTRHFGIQFEILLGGSREGIRMEWNNIDSSGRKGSLLIQTLYLYLWDRGRGKTEDFT